MTTIRATWLPVPLDRSLPDTVPPTSATMAPDKSSTNALNLKDAWVPASLVITIVGCALMLQARLIGVEHEVRDLRAAVERTSETATEKLRAFAELLQSRNPTMSVPEVR